MNKDYVESDICKICAKHKDLHDNHNFIPITIPNGCKCNLNEWIDYNNIPPICDYYEEDNKIYGSDICKNCQHSKQCHKDF